MSIGTLAANEVRRKVRGVLGWRSVAFAERYTAEPEAGGEGPCWNLSDPRVMAAALLALFRAQGVRSVLATIVAPRRVISVPDDGNEEVVQLDPRMDQVWRREGQMAQNMPLDRVAALGAVFREAGVRRGFRGGITANGADCLRLSELLAIYAFDMCNDVLFVCDETSLAVMASHEADILVYSQDDQLLARCTKILGGLGLKPYPGGLRPMETPPRERG